MALRQLGKLTQGVDAEFAAETLGLKDLVGIESQNVSQFPHVFS